MELLPSPVKNTLSIINVAVVAVGLLGYGGYRYFELQKQNTVLEEKVAGLEKTVGELERSLASTTEDIARTRQENLFLAEILLSEQEKNSVFQSQIENISGTVGALQKLSETDPELLKKYSKVYFLNENYAPARLTNIDSKYVYDTNRPQLIRTEVLPNFLGMMDAARREGIELRVVSAYRSFYEQMSVKLGHTVTYGAGTANQFSADQGYSEHQLGTAVDLTLPEFDGISLDFETSPAYSWLTNNAYKFGFILSYPQHNSYYEFEPWHWRFVGTALSTTLYNGKKYFYNMGQSDINQYLISIFD